MCIDVDDPNNDPHDPHWRSWLHSMDVGRSTIVQHVPVDVDMEEAID